MKPVRLEARPQPRIWGSLNLQPWFPDPAEKIGEVWFSVSDQHPLLVKFLFTTEKLSVQVHPRDEYAAIHHNGSRGKTEMWHILRADPGAAIALGFKREISREELRAASATGEIENLLRWVPVHPGETYLTPAGTVHAIGGGLALCEIQQNSDITYRLYDYGRGRDLHLDHGVTVSDLGAHPGMSVESVECAHFSTRQMNISAPVRHSARGEELLIVLDGSGSIAGERFRLGEVWHVPEGAPAFGIEPDASVKMLQSYARDAR
ncbi:MAG: class I mannose-6-phosphate isomerase [Acidobacteriota bacterium]|nr:class I mannose-6-phosphate isomerase [Acidobacteriota bacterium]